VGIVDNMGFRENLKSELAYSGMLVKELAAKSGVKKYCIDNYLNSRGQMPAADVAVKLAKVLGVSVEYLVTGCEEGDHRNISSLNPDLRAIVEASEELNSAGQKYILAMIQNLKKLETASKEEKRE
jgi:transcriptional regulator with XRE-family HTH domain